MCNNYERYWFDAAIMKGGNLAYADGHAKYKGRVGISYYELVAYDANIGTGAKQSDSIWAPQNPDGSWQFRPSTDQRLLDPKLLVDNWGNWYGCNVGNMAN